jgi:hypothetical protein
MLIEKTPGNAGVIVQLRDSRCQLEGAFRSSASSLGDGEQPAFGLLEAAVLALRCDLTNHRRVKRCMRGLAVGLPACGDGALSNGRRIERLLRLGQDPGGGIQAAEFLVLHSGAGVRFRGRALGQFDELRCRHRLWLFAALCCLDRSDVAVGIGDGLLAQLLNVPASILRAGLPGSGEGADLLVLAVFHHVLLFLFKNIAASVNRSEAECH